MDEPQQASAEEPTPQATPPKNVWVVLMRGLAWVLIPALFVGGLALFFDPYANKLGPTICDGRFYTTKTAHNVVGNKNSYRFFCATKQGTRSLTFPLWGLSSALWYVLFSLVWLWMWHGDVYRRRPKDDTPQSSDR